jgi:GTPase
MNPVTNTSDLNQVKTSLETLEISKGTSKQTTSNVDSTNPTNILINTNLNSASTNATKQEPNQKLFIEEEPKFKEFIDFSREDESDSSKEVRVATIGNVDSGKSTLVGVLAKCIHDNGRGSARELVFNFKHEKLKGQTSSIAQEIMCFKNGKQVEPFKFNAHKNQLWSALLKESDKVVSLIDLCGHEKYLKTTIFGLTGLVPDYAMIMIGANMGLQRMTKEHIGIALALKVPIFIVVTKIDIAPETIYKETMEKLTVLLRKSAQKLPVIIRENDDISIYSESIVQNTVCPIFAVSSVTGTGVDKLREFISKLHPRKPPIFKSNNDKVEFLIDGVYHVQGIGLVVAGTLVSGTVTKNQDLLLGPDTNGEFKLVTVKSIHFKRTPVDEIQSGNSCCFNIKSSKITLRRDMFRKGMVLVDKDNTQNVVWEFEGEVAILHHATMIKQKYQAVIHCGNIRQSAKIVSMNVDLLRTNDKGIVRFRFLQAPELIHVGSDFLFREGTTRGCGKITKLFFDIEKVDKVDKNQKNHMQKIGESGQKTQHGNYKKENK